MSVALWVFRNVLCDLFHKNFETKSFPRCLTFRSGCSTNCGVKGDPVTLSPDADPEILEGGPRTLISGWGAWWAMCKNLVLDISASNCSKIVLVSIVLQYTCYTEDTSSTRVVHFSIVLQYPVNSSQYC